MATTATASSATWTSQEVEGLLVDLLAGQLGEDPLELRQRLLVEGADMPIDSLDLFDVLADFRGQTGITVRKRELGRRTMRSVRRFARFVTGEAGA
jgi:acyl carrier protein